MQDKNESGTGAAQTAAIRPTLKKFSLLSKPKAKTFAIIWKRDIDSKTL